MVQLGLSLAALNFFNSDFQFGIWWTCGMKLGIAFGKAHSIFWGIYRASDKRTLCFWWGPNIWGWPDGQLVTFEWQPFWCGYLENFCGGQWSVRHPSVTWRHAGRHFGSIVVPPFIQYVALNMLYITGASLSCYSKSTLGPLEVYRYIGLGSRHG